MLIHEDGTIDDLPVEWSVEAIKEAMGGDFNIVANWQGQHVIERRHWHSVGLQYNRTASEMIGRALHGKVLVIKEPKKDDTGEGKR